MLAPWKCLVEIVCRAEQDVLGTFGQRLTTLSKRSQDVLYLCWLYVDDRLVLCVSVSSQAVITRRTACLYGCFTTDRWYRGCLRLSRTIQMIPVPSARQTKITASRKSNLASFNYLSLRASPITIISHNRCPSLVRTWWYPLWFYQSLTAASVEDGGPTLKQHWVNVSCLLGKMWLKLCKIH